MQQSQVKPNLYCWKCGQHLEEGNYIKGINGESFCKDDDGSSSCKREYFAELRQDYDDFFTEFYRKD
jgi:hypothetical protein